MTELSLQQQIERLTNQLKQRIGQLPPGDPLNDWFPLELDSLVQHHEDKLDLQAANARLRGLKQLSHLVMQHFVRLRNPDFDEPVGESKASTLSIEARLPAGVLENARTLRFSIEPALLHEPAAESDSDPVSPTAKVVGYLRGLDQSLQVTNELSMETEGESLMQKLDITDPVTQASMAVLFQSRYHAMNAAIAKADSAFGQILEFASGISPRGMQWSGMSPGTIYVESDLPQLMIHKAKLIRNAIIASNQQRLGVMHCCGADVLNLETMQEALTSLDTANPFTLVTEGLLLYFGANEMKQFLNNIRELLKCHPDSVWVTDLVSKANLKELLDSHAGVAAGVRKVFALTGREVVPENPFQTEADIHQYLDDHDLAVDSTVSLRDVTSELQFEVDIPQAQRDAIVGTRRVWRVKLK